MSLRPCRQLINPIPPVLEPQQRSPQRLVKLISHRHHRRALNEAATDLQALGRVPHAGRKQLMIGPGPNLWCNQPRSRLGHFRSLFPRSAARFDQQQLLRIHWIGLRTESGKNRILGQGDRLLGILVQPRETEPLGSKGKPLRQYCIGHQSECRQQRQGRNNGEQIIDSTRPVEHRTGQRSHDKGKQADQANEQEPGRFPHPLDLKVLDPIGTQVMPPENRGRLLPAPITVGDCQKAFPTGSIQFRNLSWSANHPADQMVEVAQLRWLGSSRRTGQGLRSITDCGEQLATVILLE